MYTMKKIFILTCLLTTISFITSEVSAQPYGRAYGVRKRQSFYYYPNQNVYYNMESRRYVYPQNGIWISVASLPFQLTVTNMPRYEVNYYGEDVWVDNYRHRSAYPVYIAPQPVVVAPRPVVVKKTIIVYNQPQVVYRRRY